MRMDEELAPLKTSIPLAIAGTAVIWTFQGALIAGALSFWVSVIVVECVSEKSRCLRRKINNGLKQNDGRSKVQPHVSA